MATVIRSPRVGQPRRIVASVQSAAPIREEELRGAEFLGNDSVSVPGQVFEAASDEMPSAEPDALQSALDAYKNELAGELQHAVKRAELAEQRLKELEMELGSLSESARQAGHEEGQRNGQAEGRRAFDELAGALESMIASLDRQRVTLLEEKEDRMVEIVYAAVTRILGESFVSQSGAQHAVQQVLRHVSQRDAMIIRVAPRDHAALDALWKNFPGESHASAIEFVADERVELGGCILETAGGTLDGRLEVQLQNLKEALLSVRAQRLIEAETAG